MNKRLRLAFVATLFFLSGCVVSVPDFTKIHPLVEKTISGAGPSKILVIEISGTITRTDYLQNFQGKPKINVVSRVTEELGLAINDPAIRAIVLLIDSPGGEVTASDLLYHELESFKKKTGIPIIANFVSIGASGAYYIAMSSNKIVAHPTAIVGSIGVIVNSVNVTKLMDKIGVDAVTYKSGDFKDMTSPMKPVVEDETRLMQEIVDNMHRQFVDVVVKGRQMDRAKVEKLADGRIYTPLQARDSGLIDEIGYVDDTIEVAKQEAGVSFARVIMYHRANEYRENVYNKNHTVSNKFMGLDVQELVTKANSDYLYLWQP